KLPDRPLAVHDGLLPETVLGIQMRGGIPAGPTKFEYAVYVANAPKLNTDDPDALGTLDFDNFHNEDGHVAFGGHLGFFPIPELELGYGIQGSKVGPSNSDVDALLHSVDLNYVRDSKLLKGTLAIRAQWVWSHVGRFTYDEDGALGVGPLT